MTHDHDRHDEEHSHPHDDASNFRPEQRLPPSRQGTVVLDIGDGIGALVVHTPSSLAGREIELARVGERKPFVHTDVRARELPGGTVYAGVFAELQEGDYTLLHIAQHPSQDVTIRSGHVTDIDLSH